MQLRETFCRYIQLTTGVVFFFWCWILLCMRYVSFPIRCGFSGKWEAIGDSVAVPHPTFPPFFLFSLSIQVFHYLLIKKKYKFFIILLDFSRIANSLVKLWVVWYMTFDVLFPILCCLYFCAPAIPLWDDKPWFEFHGSPGISSCFIIPGKNKNRELFPSALIKQGDIAFHLKKRKGEKGNGKKKDGNFSWVNGWWLIVF